LSVVALTLVGVIWLSHVLNGTDGKGTNGLKTANEWAAWVITGDAHA
jgi:hypothetical protein